MNKKIIYILIALVILAVLIFAFFNVVDSFNSNPTVVLLKELFIID